MHHFYWSRPRRSDLGPHFSKSMRHCLFRVGGQFCLCLFEGQSRLRTTRESEREIIRDWTHSRKHVFRIQGGECDLFLSAAWPNTPPPPTALPTDAVSCAEPYQSISEYHKHLTAPPLCTEHLVLIFLTEMETLLLACSLHTSNAAQMTSHCCSAALSMKGVSRFFWYKECLLVTSALLQTSWRDNIYSFISGRFYADGRLHEQQKSHFKRLPVLQDTTTTTKILPHHVRTAIDRNVLLKERREQAMHAN